MDVKTYRKNKYSKSLILLFFAIIFSLSFINSNAQAIKLEKKISIVAKNKSLSSILSEIEQKSGINFSYSQQQIDVEQKITLIARKKKVEDVLSQLFNEAAIEYIIVEKQLILKPKIIKKETLVEVAENKPQKYVISGHIRDNETGEALIGATVTIKDKPVGTITNEYGFYSLSLPKGNYTLQFSYIGYASSIQEVELAKNTEISQKLQLDETDLEVIVVSAEENKDIHEINPLKKINLSPLSQNLRTGVSGSGDLFQSFQTIPGLQTMSDGSVFFFTRGGNKDQNLILVDEAPIYNPSHLFGFISAVSPEAINDVSIYKNYFPVQYGGRLSSIIDIRIKDGNMNNLGLYGTVTPFTNSFNLEGPLIREKASYHISFRSSNVNWLNNLFSSNFDLRFIDLHTKLNFKLGAKNRIYFSFYTGNDNIKNLAAGEEPFFMKWQNFASTLRWNHLYSDRLFSNIMLFTSFYDYYLYASVEDDLYWNTLIGNLSIKSDFTYFANAKNTIRFGCSINSHYFNPGNINDEYFTQKVKASGVSQLTLFWGQDLRISPDLSLNYGIRMVNWNNIGPTTIYKFNESSNPIDTTEYKEGVFNSFLHFEPRIELIYSFNTDNSLQFSYNHNIQHLHLVSNSISPFTTLDIWIPSNPNINPQIMDQFVLGYYSRLTEFDFSIEGFYKKMLNQIEYTEGANMLLNPLIESELRFGESDSYGIELSMKKQRGNFTGWINYSYSRCINKFDDINSGKSYPAYYDKPHQFNLNLSYKLSRRWQFIANWVYVSGTRFSEPTSFYYYNSYLVPVYSQKNNAKLPDYHRLDISVNFRVNKNPNAKYSHQLSFSILNLYGKKNPVAINFNKIQNEDGKYIIPANYITENQIIPTNIYLLGVLPLISYKFNFQNRKTRD